MKNTIRLVHWTAAIALGVILLTAAWATAEDDKVIVAFEKTYMDPLVTREAAITLAQQYTGLAEKVPVRARDGLATDTSITFSNVLKRPAWEVVFEGGEVSITKRDGTEQKNPNISTITVLLDAETGALLKVSSPKPPTGGVSEDMQKRLKRNPRGLELKETTAKPHIPFMQALRAEWGLVAGAKQVIAYFGLLTDHIEMGRKRGIKDKPHWVIFLGGGDYGPPSGGPGTHATQARVVVDAESGGSYRTSISGGHITGGHGGRHPLHNYN